MSVLATSQPRSLSYRPASRCIIVALATLLAGSCSAIAGEDPPAALVPTQRTNEPVLPMMLDPELVQPPAEVLFDPRNIKLWLLALGRPEFDLRVDAIEAFATAHRRGVKGLHEALPVIEGLLTSDPQPDVRFAAARALIAFDHRAAAPALQAAAAENSNAQSGLIFAVDDALAEWSHPGASAMWIARLRHCREHPSAGISAIKSLASVGAGEAGAAITRCARDQTLSAAVRLEAARALPAVRAAGRSELAAELAAEPAPWGPLMAIVALGAADGSQATEHLDAESIRLADSLASSPDARVRAYAVALLRRAVPSIALAKANLMRDPDEQVRLEMTRTFGAAPPSDLGLATLAAALDDPSEPVRTSARRALIPFGRDASTAAAVATAMDLALSRARWKEAEQAAILAGELGSASAAGRLTALLNFDRPEVRIAAVTSLRALGRPESLPAMLDRAKELTGSAVQSAQDPPRFESIGQETAQIFMAMAQSRYSESVDLLKSYIPKRSGFHPLARGAAVYALGKIFESRPDADLADQLQARAADNNPLDPEAAEVRRFAAIGLARMGAREALSTLRELYEAENSTVSVGGACRWAIMQLEGIELPPCRPVVTKAGPFFLESIEPAPQPGPP